MQSTMQEADETGYSIRASFISCVNFSKPLKSFLAFSIK